MNTFPHAMSPDPCPPSASETAMPPAMEEAMNDVELVIKTLTGLATVCNDLPDGIGCDAFDRISEAIAELNRVRRSDYFVPKPVNRWEEP